MTTDIVIMNIGLIFAEFICSWFTALFLTYVKVMCYQLEFTNEENVKLLDGMHEGLIILNKKNLD